VAVSQASSDIVNALQALGYNEKEAAWAAKQLPKEVGVSDGIRQALKLLSKG
jgi:Holliday junction DNA helicase RuvA